MIDIGFYDNGGLKLRSEPARDACFKIVRHDTEMHDHPEFSEAARRELVHRHMSNEITSLDIAAACLVDFADAPWELRMELARQCWDESRHITVLHRRLKEMGGYKGEFPISAFEWSVTCALDNLPGRLATQNRTFEAGAMDVVADLVRKVRESGDEATAVVLDGILADEVQHVRFANRWIKRLARENGRVLLNVAQAIRFLEAANGRFVAVAGDVNPMGKTFEDPTLRVPAVNVDDRRLAEFNDAEIAEILRQAGFRSLVSEGDDRQSA
jgi:uncharacterized ferritin-like protein (DUF455 family)